MKIIKIKNGIEAIVDDEDYNSLCKIKWNLRSGYAAGYFQPEDREKKVYYMHAILTKFATVGRKSMVVDHINRNKLDNRKENLRIVTRKENRNNCDYILKERMEKIYRNISNYRGLKIPELPKEADPHECGILLAYYCGCRTCGEIAAFLHYRQSSSPSRVLKKYKDFLPTLRIDAHKQRYDGSGYLIGR